MGQANQRGTFEQRKAEAQKRSFVEYISVVETSDGTEKQAVSQRRRIGRSPMMIAAASLAALSMSGYISERK